MKENYSDTIKSVRIFSFLRFLFIFKGLCVLKMQLMGFFIVCSKVGTKGNAKKRKVQKNY